VTKEVEKVGQMLESNVPRLLTRLTGSRGRGRRGGGSQGG
jgi:hypothetical protein